MAKLGFHVCSALGPRLSSLFWYQSKEKLKKKNNFRNLCFALGFQGLGLVNKLLQV